MSVDFDPTLHFQCTKLDCDNRPFSILQSELDEADGEIKCEYCDSVCSQVGGAEEKDDSDYYSWQDDPGLW